MYEFDIYFKMDGTLKGRLVLEQSGVMANTPYEAVVKYMRAEAKVGSAANYTARRASLNSAAPKAHGAW